jgi:hypothetical protein
MNRLDHLGIAIALLLLPTLSSAQQLASANSPTSSGSSSSLPTVQTPEQARKDMILVLPKLRQAPATNDETRTNLFSEANVTSKGVSTNGNSTLEYKLFLDKTTGFLTQQFDALKNAKYMQADIERNRLQSAMATVKSAGCFAGDNVKTQSYGVTKTMEGFEVVAFPLDSLRRNSRYGMVENYKNGYARIRKDQVYGYVNLCGEEFITPQYEKGEPFNAGKAIVKRVDWFFVNTEGEESEAMANISEAKALTNGVTLLRLSNLKQVFIDNNFDQSKAYLSQLYDGIEPFYKSSIYKIRQGKKVGLMGLDGKEILSAVYDDIDTTNTEGVYKVVQTNLIGLMDTAWKIQVPIMIQSMSAFNRYGLSVLTTDKGVAVMSRKGFRLSTMYASVGEFSENGLASIRTADNLVGVMDKNMDVVVAPKYTSIGSFNGNGLAAACLPGNKCGYINTEGKEVIKMNYEGVTDFNKFGLAVVKTRVTDCGKSGVPCVADIVIDQEGNVIVPVTGESVEQNYRYYLTDSLFSDNFIILDGNGKIGNFKMLINRTSFKLITVSPYEAISPLDILGNFRVRDNGLWGIIDSTGKVLAKPIFKEMIRQAEEYYAAKNDKDKWGFLNRKGKAQIPFEYDEVQSYRGGFATVSKGKGKWGIINKFNGKIAPCAFKTISINEKTADYEMRDAENLLILMDKEGNCKTNCPKLEAYRAQANKDEGVPTKK